MSTPYEFESWNSDVEFGNGREFEDGEAEWEAEFRRRAWRPRPVAPGMIPRRPWRPRPVARPDIIARRPFRQPFRGWRPVRWPRPPRPVYYPVILPQWDGWLPDGQPREPAAGPRGGGAPFAEPTFAEPPVAEPAFAEPPGAEPPLAEPPGPEPAAAAAPDMEARAGVMPGPINIQPEPFEFDMELRGYEGESLESGFGEFENRRPRPAPSALPDPPVDKNPVSGCTTPGRPFDDFQFRSPAVPARHGPRIKELAKLIVNSWVTDPDRLGIRTVCLEGHTDNVGPTDVNMRLGLARAKNLRAKLKRAIFDEAKKTGFGQQITDSVTILVSSRGEANPVAPNTTPLGRRRNRRVRFAFST
jgi:OmpA family